MSNIVISVNGSTAGDGFLVAPDNGRTFSVPLTLRTSDGTTVTATVDVTPNGGGVTVPGGTVSIGPAGTPLTIFATTASAVRGDTQINVHTGAGTTSYNLTAIQSPQVWFRGRFQARFATDGDYYNNPRGNDGGTVGNDPTFGGPGWTWALEGEPDFVPSGVDVHGVPNSVPNPYDKPVGRVVRFNNPVSLRSHAAPVGTAVDEIHGTLSTSAVEVFTSGDPIIGAAADLGPNTYLAANQPANPGEPAPAESNLEGYEPMALFEFHIDGFFSGAAAAMTDRPTAGGVVSPLGSDPATAASDAADKAAIGWTSLATFEAGRLAQLQADYAALSPADRTGTVTGRNLATRIAHLTPVSTTLGQGWDGKEEYNGKVNAGLQFQPSTSAVLAYLEGYTGFQFFSKLFAFHSDELCGYVHGSLTADPTAPLVKTCSLQLQNSTFGKDELLSMGLPATFPSAFWVVFDGFFPSELGIDATDMLTSPANPPAVNFTVNSPANPAVVNALVTLGQLRIQPFTGPVLTTAVPPPNAPQRILYPFTIQFTGTDGFVDPIEYLTLTATITVNGKSYSATAPLVLTTAANPYVTDADAGNNYTSWLSTDLRVFKVDEDEPFFGARVNDYYPTPGSAGPVSAAAASSAATRYIANVIAALTAGGGTAGGTSFETDLHETEADSRSQLEFLQTNPRSGKPAFNFAICRVRLRGTTPPAPPPPFTTQAVNCRVFFRAFQAQTTSSTYNPLTTYRSTPIATPDVTPRVALAGYTTDAMSQDEFVTIPFFAVDRVNLAGPANLTTQAPDEPNVQTITPATGVEVDTYYGVWLDINQPTPLFPQFAKPGDYDNATGYFGTGIYAVQSINAAFTRAPHQCLIAEVAFDDVPIPTNADSSTSDKLAQRNLAYIDGPNPGVTASRLMPHPFQVQATNPASKHADEVMISWGDTPAGSVGELYLPGTNSADIVALADKLYGTHQLRAVDAHTVSAPRGPVTFVPIPKGTGLLAGLFTVELPLGIRRGDAYTVVVRQITDASRFLGRGESVNKPPAGRGAKNAALRAKAGGAYLREKLQTWRRVLGAFQVKMLIGTKHELLGPEEHRLAAFRWIAEQVLPQSRWYPVMQRYVGQIAGRVGGFGGHPGSIPPSQGGALPGRSGGGHGPGGGPGHGPGHSPGHGGGHGHEPGGECGHAGHDTDDAHEGHEGRCDHEIAGKVAGLVFDRFGDFEGFLVATEDGCERSFTSREAEVEALVRAAWTDRAVIAVVVDGRDLRRPARIILRRPGGCGEC